MQINKAHVFKLNNISEEQVPIDDLPTSKPVVSPTFWEDEFFDDLDIKMKLRYLKGRRMYFFEFDDEDNSCPVTFGKLCFSVRSESSNTKPFCRLILLYLI